MVNSKSLKNQVLWTLLLLSVVLGLIFIFEKGEELGRVIAQHH